MPIPDAGGFPLSTLNTVRCGPRGGPPVVLLHAVGLDLSYWDRQIEALSLDHDVVGIDLPGHGRSSGRPEEWTLANAAAVVAALIRSLDAGPAHVVGLSVGGMIAQAVALREPALVHSLVLIDTCASFEDDAREAMRARAQDVRSSGMPAVLRSTVERWFTAVTIASRPDLIDRVTKTLLQDDPLIHAAMWEMVAELDLVDELPRINCPTMILVGEHDLSSPPSAARQMRDGIRGSAMHVIPAAAHLSPLEHPGVITDHLKSFLVNTLSVGADVRPRKG